MSSELVSKDREQLKSLSLTDRLKLRRSMKALVLDVSGSMSFDVEPGKSKISALREVVAGMTISPKMYWFSSRWGECDSKSIPDPHGATYLAPLLENLKMSGIMSVLVMTDGDINDKEATKIAAKDMTIQVFYIGAGQRPAFLDELANSSGGYATTEDLKQTKELTAKVQLLIGSGSGEIKTGAIEL